MITHTDRCKTVVLFDEAVAAGNAVARPVRCWASACALNSARFYAMEYRRISVPTLGAPETAKKLAEAEELAGQRFGRLLRPGYVTACGGFIRCCGEKVG